MDREYNLFEQLPDGSPLWRDHVSGAQNLRLKLLEIASTTNNLCFAMHLPTKEIVARLAASSSHAVLPSKRAVFQIAYDDNLAVARATELRNRGYEVVSVIGNESAKLILTGAQRFGLFMVGHAAPEKDRKEMVTWLKKNFPGTRILALNPPKEPVLVGADYNVQLDGPEAWLPIVSSALSKAW